MSISDDTEIIPEAVARTVINEAEILRSLPVPDSAEDELVTRAEELYKHNETFRKKIRRNNEKARDYLYSFMQHWLDAIVKKNRA